MIDLTVRQAGMAPEPKGKNPMDEQFTIREAFIALMAASPRVDETNAIQVHRRFVRNSGDEGWDIDELADDFEVTEKAQAMFEAILP